MKRRETYYKDYGLSNDDVKRLKSLCKKLDEDGQIALFGCAVSANIGVASLIYISLVYGLSYDLISSIMYIPISKTDFYAYQRYCLYLFSKKQSELQTK